MYFFIINNQSGKGMKVWKQLVPILQKKQIEYKAFILTVDMKDSHIKNEIATTPNIKALVIVGGDGTIQKALTLIEKKSIPIAVIPAGSGNDFARAMNIPKNSCAALDKILTGKPTSIDIMKVNEHCCTTVVGVGFDAKVADRTNHSRLKKWLNSFRLEKFVYVFGVLREVFTYRPTNVEITIDGTKNTFSNVWLVAIANTPFYGGGLKISPDADNTDRTLNLCVAHSLSRLELLMFFPLVFLGKHVLHRSVVTLSGLKIEVASNHAIPVQADGEMLGVTPISIAVRQEKLSIIL